MVENLLETLSEQKAALIKAKYELTAFYIRLAIGEPLTDEEMADLERCKQEAEGLMDMIDETLAKVYRMREVE